jgi:RNA polymerase sigma-70 factor (ECF subfamily)
MDTTDSQLLRRVAAGDKDAFAAFYDRHAPVVLGLLRRLLHQPGDADDVLQETFWQVWRQASTFDPARGAALGWVLMIARSRALDHLRRQRATAALGDASEPLSFAEAAAALERDEASAHLRAALACLPDEQRSALRLAFYGGLTHAEVARRQGIPLGTAKTRIRLAMCRLRDLLRPHYEVSAS